MTKPLKRKPRKKKLAQPPFEGLHDLPKTSKSSSWGVFLVVVGILALAAFSYAYSGGWRL
jgi:fatty acid desaturase